MAGLIDGKERLLMDDLSERIVCGLDEGEGHRGVCLSSPFIRINYSDTTLGITDQSSPIGYHPQEDLHSDWLVHGYNDCRHCADTCYE